LRSGSLSACYWDQRLRFYAVARRGEIAVETGSIPRVRMERRRAATIGLLRRSILCTNERIACRVGNQLTTDHFEIDEYVLTPPGPAG